MPSEGAGTILRWSFGVAAFVVLMSVAPNWLWSIPKGQITTTLTMTNWLVLGSVLIAAIAGSLFIPRGEPLAIWITGIAASLVVFVLVALFASCNGALSESGKEACAFEAGGYAIAPVVALLALVPRLVVIGLRAGLQRARQGIRDTHP